MVVDHVGHWHHNIYVFNSLSYLDLFLTCSFDDSSLKYPIPREPGDKLELEQVN